MGNRLHILDCFKDMERIASFRVDHNKLLRGLYVSRKDTLPSGEVITTFDIRMTEPNRQPALKPEVLHAMEHLAATFLRNHPDWGKEIIYWGPMGCCTGNYLILKGDRESEDIVSLMSETMKFIADYEGHIPGASPSECGNYTFMDLAGARQAASRYKAEVLDCINPSNLSYPS